MVLTLQYLMWNIELKTLNCFSCFPAHDLGHLGPVSPKLLYCPKYKKKKKNTHTHTCRIQQCDAFTNWVRPQLMWIMDLEILDSFSCVSAQITKFPQTKFSRKLLFMFPSPRSWVFEPGFFKITIMHQIPKKTGQIQPCDGVNQLSKASINVNHWLGDFGFLFMCIPAQITKFPQTKFPWKLLFVFPTQPMI